MATTDTVMAESDAPTTKRNLLASWWAIALVIVILGLALGWRFLADPSLSAPTRDPAWYTWRSQVILDANPDRVVQEWGPHGLFAGGYRVSVPFAGAFLQRVVGIDRYTFSTLFMIAIPILTGLALAAAFFRSRRNPLVIHMTLLATVAMFLATPYVGYLDNITVLFLLSLMIPFAHAARTSWGARTALFLIGIAAAFTHPTTCVIFGGILLSVFGWHFLTSRFSFGAALRSDGPLLFSVGLGMFAGLACWVIGIWGSAASLAEAALPPPYTAEFFAARLKEWTLSLQPAVIVPFIIVAIGSTIAWAKRHRDPARTEDQVSIWWLVAFIGALTVVTGKEIPYYRFMNASAAPMALLGLGSYATIRWFFTDRAPSKWIGWGGVGLMLWAVVAWVKPDLLSDAAPVWIFTSLLLIGALVALRGFAGDILPRTIAGSLVAILVVASIGWIVVDGLQRRWVSDSNQWANQSVRTSLAAVHEVVNAAGDRPIVLLTSGGGRPAATYFDHDDPDHGHEHRLRVDEDLLQRVPHRSVGRSDRACRDLPGHGAELPGGAADDVVHRQRRLRRRRAVALLRGVPGPEQPVRQPGTARGLRAALRAVPRAAGRVRDQGLLRRSVQRAGVPGRRSGDAGQRAAGREGRAVPAGDGPTARASRSVPASTC